MNQFSETQKQSLLKAFLLFDKNNDGMLEEEELRVLMTQLDSKQSEEKLSMLLKEVDVDGNMKLDFAEFLMLMGKQMAASENPADIKEAFNLMDSNGDGFVTFEELKEALRSIGDESSEAEISNMIREADEDGDGKVSLEDFQRLMHR